VKGHTRDPNTLRAQYLKKVEDLETRLKKTTNRKWPMVGYGESNGHVIDDVR